MYIFGNWKDKLDVKSSSQLATQIASDASEIYSNIDIVIFPDDVSLVQVALILESSPIIKSVA